MPKIFATTIGALCLALLAIGCGGSNEEGGGIKRTDTATLVTVYTADKAATLDPHATDDGGDTKVLIQIFETLVRVDPNDTSKLLPVLATKWEPSGDGKTIAFTLREGVKFHDGSDFDASVAARSIMRVAKELTGAPYASQYSAVTNAEAKDGKLLVHTSEAMPDVMLRNLSTFSASIVSGKVLDEAAKLSELGAQNNYVRENAIGTGPFKLKDYSKDGVVSLEANDTYWGGAPSIKTLVFRQVQEAQTRVEKLTGDEPCVVDDVARSEWEKLGDKVHKWWALNCCYLGINTKSGGKALQDFRIRKAIQLAMDREALAALYLGTAQPSYTLLPPTFAETDKKFRPADTEMPLEERVARAKVLIQESGIKGDDLKVTLKFPQNPRPYLPEPSKTAERVKQQLAKVGIQVEPESVPNSVLFSSFDNEQHQMVLLGWMSDNADPDNYFGPLTGATMREGKMVANSNNVGRTTDDKVNDAIRAARSLTDSGARAKAYQAIEADQQERLIGYVPLVNTQQGIAISSKLKGVEIDKLGHYRFHKASIAD